MTPERMAALHGQCFQDRPWSAQEFSTLRATSTNRIWYAPEGNGFLLVQVIAPEAEILTLAVAPNAQRGGIATELLERAKSDLSAYKVDTLFLEVAETNLAARALYRKSGFDEIARRRNYYDGKTDALILRHTLDR